MRGGFVTKPKPELKGASCLPSYYDGSDDDEDGVWVTEHWRTWDTYLASLYWSVTTITTVGYVSCWSRRHTRFLRLARD